MNNTNFDPLNFDYHPACQLFPTLSDEDFRALADDIKENGLLEPIIVYNGEILDGRNRFEACEVSGVDPQFIAWNGDGSPAQFVISKNLHRRHLTASQRAAIAYELLPMLEAEAKERQRLSKGRGVKGEKYCADEKGKASEHVAKIANSSSTYVELLKRADNKAPELIKEVQIGTLSAKNAADLSELPEAQRKEVLEKARKPKAKVARLIRQAERNHLAALEKQDQKEITLHETIIGSLESNSINVGDCQDLIPSLPDESINLAVTSPPYADQRKGMYPGIPEKDYPDFTVDWMAKLWDKLTDDGSVLIVIRPHLRKGVISDYVLRTRLALRDFGWKECEELIWYKPDGGGCQGSNHRPRRAYEHILWFSKTHKPFDNTKICGRWSDNLAFRGSTRFGIGSNKPVHAGQSEAEKSGGTRSMDVINVPMGAISNGVMHPAMFPIPLAEHLIKTFCPEGGTVLDPFAGSGSTLIAAKQLGRQFYGFDIMKKYVEIARQRLEVISGGPMISDPEFEELRNELQIILDDGMELGGGFTQQHVRECFEIWQGTKPVSFEITLATLPEEFRDYYESLPSHAA